MRRCIPTRSIATLRNKRSELGGRGVRRLGCFGYQLIVLAAGGHLAFAAIAAPMAALAEMIAARIFGAKNTNPLRRFAANRASKSGYFHQRFFFELEGASLLIIPRQRCASASAILKFCSVLAAKSVK